MEGSWNARRWRILAIGTLGGTAALIVVLLATILLAQSHLKGPLVRYAAAHSERPIRVDGPFQLDLLSLHPTIVAEHVTIGNPPWMPPGVTAQIGRLSLTYDLPSFSQSFRLHTLQAEQATLHLTRDQEGRSNWQARAPGSGRSNGPPLIRSLHMPNARVYFDDARRRLKFDGTISAQDLPGGGPNPPLRIEGGGQLNERSTHFALNGDSLATVVPGHPYRFDFVETSSGTTLTGKGNVPQPFDFHFLETTFDSTGEDMKDLYFLTGASLPETGPYHLVGKFTRQDHHLGFTDLAATSGHSDMHGTVLIETRRGNEPSHTEADLRSQLLRLSDLGAEAAGRAAKPPDAKQLMLPVTQFHLQGMRRSDAQINFNAQVLEIGREPLRSVSVKVKIEEGILTAAPVSATLREGKISGGFKIDVTHDVPAADVDLRIAHMSLGLLDRKKRGEPATTAGDTTTTANKPASDTTAKPTSAATTATTVGRASGAAPAGAPPMEGPLQARIALKGRGNSLHELASNATGTVTAVLPHGAMRSSLAELAGFDLRGLGLMATGSKADTGVRCGVASFDVKGGTLTAQRLLIDTDPVLISGAGTINLDSEALDLQMEGHPKHPRLRVRAPLLVRGTLKHPAFSIQARKPMAQAGEAIALGVLLTPVAAMLAFVDPGLAKDSDCGALLAQVNTGTK